VASQDFVLTLPTASSAGAGTKITCIIFDIGMNSVNVTASASGSDVIYDAYNEYNNMSGGLSNGNGMSTTYSYQPLTLVSDGDGFWWTQPHGSEEGMWYAY
jgi:hypothetical protein